MAGDTTDKVKEEREDGKRKKKKRRGHSCSETSRRGMMQHIMFLVDRPLSVHVIARQGG